MNASSFLTTLTAAGLTVTAEGERLYVRPAGSLTDDLRQEIRYRKRELIALLAGGDTSATESAPVTPYSIITDTAGLRAVVEAVAASRMVGFDTETTGLDPRADRVRLLQLAPDASPAPFVIDLFAIARAALEPLWVALAAKRTVVHNAAFDLGFLAKLGFVPGTVLDTLLMSRLVYGTRHPRGFHGLQECAARELGRPLDKAEQASDWSGELTVEQLSYAAADAAVLLPLYDALRTKIEDTGLTKVAAIERRCVPALAWLAGAGFAIDRPAWEALTVEAGAEAERQAAEQDALAPPRPGDDPRWNWNSPKQIVEAFALVGVTLEKTGEAVLAGLTHPMAAALRKLRAARKLVGVYGAKWLANVATDGRVYANWNQLGSDAGRMSCCRPNLQQLPRDKRYRRCFVAPPGRALVKADYSQIELRIAAKVSGDEALLGVYQRGEDVHTLTAQRVLGVEEVTPEQRQLAKVMNFGLLYGMGARGFRAYAKTSYGVELTEEEARQYRDVFFMTYPGLAAWHQREKAAANRALFKPTSAPPDETRTLAGRRRLIGRKDPPTYRLNSPVQGTGAYGLKRALALLWERREQCPGAVPVLAVHDEIVVECDEAAVGSAAAWLRQAMIDAMAPLIHPVPVEVDVKVGHNWGETGPLTSGWRRRHRR
jgi:DNA polymerase-1